jgi:hypothetical protein
MIKKLLMLLAFAIPLATPALAGDLALGDSLALGLGRALGIATIARIGISSCSIAGMAPSGHYDRVVLSAGTNDPPGRCIESVRRQIHADHVTWVVPVNGARAHVLRLAAQFGDSTLFYAPRRGDVHPSNYVAMARQYQGSR